MNVVIHRPYFESTVYCYLIQKLNQWKSEIKYTKSQEYKTENTQYFEEKHNISIDTENIPHYKNRKIKVNMISLTDEQLYFVTYRPLMIDESCPEDTIHRSPILNKNILLYHTRLVLGKLTCMLLLSGLYFIFFFFNKFSPIPSTILSILLLFIFFNFAPIL